MTCTAREVAEALGFALEGDGSIEISGASEPASAGPSDLAIALEERYLGGLGSGKARVAMLAEGVDWKSLGLEAAIFARRAQVALAGITKLFEPEPVCPPGVHPSAVVDPSASVGEGSSIGPCVTIGPGASVGARARIRAHASIAENARIGDDALLHEGVRIGARVRIGDRFIAHGNAVIGGDGFSFVTPERGGVEQARASLGREVTARQGKYMKIRSLGSVEIGDDVEIGAGSSVDRGTLADTLIGDGTKLDCQVQVGHNARIGRECLLCAQSGVAGSARIGDRCVLAGMVGVADHVEVGDDVLTGGASVLLTNVPSGQVVMGYPAVKMATNIEIYKSLRRLPRLASRVAELEARLESLEGGKGSSG